MITMILSKQQLIADYKDLKTLTKIATKYNLCIDTIRKLFIQYNIDYKKRCFHELNHNFFSQDNENSYYWAGFIAADGNVDKSRNRITISLKIDDIDHLKKFKKSIKATNKITTQTRIENRKGFIKSEYESCTFRFSSDQIKKDLMKWNIVPNKSLTYCAPDDLNQDLIKHFIRGAIDGDGWIREQSIGLCGTKDIINYTYNHLFKKLNVVGKITQLKNIWIINYRKLSDKQKIIHYLFDDHTISLDRKRKVALSLLKKPSVKINITKEDIINAFETHKNVTLVIKHLRCSKATLFRRIREFGLQGGLYFPSKLKII